MHYYSPYTTIQNHFFQLLLFVLHNMDNLIYVLPLNLLMTSMNVHFYTSTTPFYYSSVSI